MNRRTYKALRRSLIADKISELMDDLYELRMEQDEQEYLAEMLEDPVIDVELEDET